ncbi:MAG: ABC transporter permease [Verrucomicrobia bacterium]|nr:ABC transporter permease [Verrucomicrobiota bacterium]MBS0645148.1 ABC transporter permease [Verrucomicrobiota bacterium]
MKALPGDPFTQEKALPKEILQSLKTHYKLDAPLLTQYGNYLFSLIKGDLGPSFKYKNRSVNEIIKTGFPISLTLGLEAACLALLAGIFLGTIAALRHRKWQDYVAMLLAVLGISLPSFILAAFLQYLFAIKLDLFPVARWGTWQQSVLPALSLAALPTAFIARLIRSNLLEVLNQDYIKLAKAKGLSNMRIILKHALRNAALPVMTYLGMLAVNILTGSFVIEKIFGIPGLGQWFVNSVTNRDYTTIMGLTIFYSLILLAASFLTDIAYVWIDPRIKLQKTSSKHVLKEKSDIT